MRCLGIKLEYSVKPLNDGDCGGILVVINDYISFFGEVDPYKGVHTPSGKHIADKVLVFRGGRGSTVGSYIIYALRKNNVSPRCFIVEKPDPVVVAGSILADIPLLVIREYNDFIVNVCDGYKLEYDRGKRIVRVYK
ncbi:MAG: DUF126 domain-containing protein [Thermoprotei archaeon]